MKANVLISATDASDDADEGEFIMPATTLPRRLPQPQQSNGLAALPSGEISSLLVRQALQSLPYSADISARDDASNKAAAIDLMEALEPKDAIEGMLSAQIVGLHNMTMDCMRRAQISTGPDRESLLNQLNKTSRTFGLLVETLNKHRGKGRQTMVVEHVHVHQGGQAIVGHVEAGARVGDSEPGGGAKKRGQSHG